MELCKLLTVAAWANTWSWAGSFGISAAAVIGLLAVVVSTVIAEKYFGASTGDGSAASARKIIVGAIGAIAGPLCLWGILFLISLFFVAPASVLNDVRTTAASQQRDADHKQWTRNTQQLRDDLEAAKSKTGPHLSCEIDFIQSGITKEKVNVAEMLVLVGIRNTGVPSIAQTLQLTVSNGENTLEGSPVYIPTKWRLHVSKSKYIEIKAADALYNKVETIPVPTGGLQRGWLAYQFPATAISAIQTPGAIVTLRLADVIGQQSSCSQPLGENGVNSPEYWPGVTQAFHGNWNDK